MKIVIAADHGGFKLKEYLKQKLPDINFKDVGTFSEESVDYPDYISKAASLVSKGKYDKGIVICGTGIGASIVANKFKNVRAALVHNSYTAKMSRLHNNANMLVLGGRVLSKRKALKLVKLWLNTPFSEEERHIRRNKKIQKIEKKNMK